MNRPVTLVEPGTVKLERLLPGPIERVWAYVTESDKRAKWLAPGRFDLRVGGRIELLFDNDNLSSDKKPKQDKGQPEPMTGVITRLEPPHLLSHTWMWSHGETECTYQLAERGSQVLLTITHRRMSKELELPIMAGWDAHSGILEDVLKGVEPRPFWKTHERLAKEYAEAAKAPAAG